jgi:hypothetical protein
MGLCLVPSAFEGATYRDDNFALLLAWKPNKTILQQAHDLSIPWHYHVRLHSDGLTDELKTQLQNIYTSYRGGQGWMVWDEPKRSQMFTAAPTLQWLREQYPETLVYSNAYPIGIDLNRANGAFRQSSLYPYIRLRRRAASVSFLSFM